MSTRRAAAFAVIAHRRGCADRVLARVPRGSDVTIVLEPFVRRDKIDARSICGAFQPTQPTLTYTLTPTCLTQL